MNINQIGNKRMERFCLEALYDFYSYLRQKEIKHKNWNLNM